MSREKVTSREYKIMLRKELFTGIEQQLLICTSNFWQAFTQAIRHLVININGDLQEITDKRIIKFYDTHEHLLNSNNYVLRERYDIDLEEREVTLKFRHPDRYLSQERNMKAGDSHAGKTKFEEDIKPRFAVLYSFSTTQKISAHKDLSKMQDAARLYPDLPDKLTHYREEEEIKIVGDTVRELVVQGAKFQIRNNPKLEAECALILWYNDSSHQQQPVAVEFSFRYGDENENYTRKIAQRAYDVFQELQEKLTYWVDPNSQTKTAYIYGIST